jgi:hypothetical protein
LGELDGGPSWYLLPPFPIAPAVPHARKTIKENPTNGYHEYDDGFSYEEGSILVPVSLAENGNQLVKQFESLAASRTVGSCEDSRCDVFLDGFVPGSDISELVAVCSVDLRSGEQFPLLKTCRVLSFKKDDQTWVRVVISKATSGTSNVPSAITMEGFRWEIQSASESYDFLTLVKTRVSQPPLSLRTDGSGAGLVAFAEWRNSAIVPHHKEQIEIFFDVRRKGTDSTGGHPVYYFELLANPEVLVSWRPIYEERAPPDHKEILLYRSAILGTVTEALSPVCKPNGANEVVVFVCK